jgi:hypothetical protein
MARDDHDTIRQALNSRSDKLQLCMINPGAKLNSHYIIGGANETNRLEGDKFKMPKYDEYDFDDWC